MTNDKFISFTNKTNDRLCVRLSTINAIIQMDSGQCIVGLVYGMNNGTTKDMNLVEISAEEYKRICVQIADVEE